MKKRQRVNKFGSALIAQAKFEQLNGLPQTFSEAEIQYCVADVEFTERLRNHREILGWEEVVTINI